MVLNYKITLKKKIICRELMSYAQGTKHFFQNQEHHFITTTCYVDAVWFLGNPSTLEEPQIKLVILPQTLK